MDFFKRVKRNIVFAFRHSIRYQSGTPYYELSYFLKTLKKELTGDFGPFSNKWDPIKKVYVIEKK